MKLLRNMKIKWKLLTGFGVIILLTTIMASMSYIQLSSVDDSYNNILNGTVTRSIAMLNIEGNFAAYRRIASQAVIYSGDNNQLSKLNDEYKTLKSDTDSQFANYFASLEIDSTLDNAGVQSRKAMVNDLKSILDSDYDSIIKSIFSYAEKGDEAGAKIALLGAAETATSVTKSVEDVLTSARNTRLTMTAETSAAARQSKIILVALSVAIVLIAVLSAMSIAAIISKGIITVISASKKIADGDFDVSVGSNDRDEIADLSNTLSILKDTVKALVHDIEHVSSAFNLGDIDARIDLSTYKGEFKVVAEGINDTLSSMVDDLSGAIETVVAFGDGDFDVPIRQCPGKKEILTTSFKSVQTNLKMFNSDIQSVIKGASAGNLDININTSLYKGDWKMMSSGINGLLTAVVNPVREAITVMNLLAEGNLSASVTGNYQGEFAVMKTALNNTMQMLSSYIKEISEILNGLADNNLDQSVEREYVGQFKEIKNALNTIIENLNRMISEIVGAAQNVAIGSEHIAGSSSRLAQGASEQASSVEELNATIVIINENTNQNTKNAEGADALSKDSQTHAVRGNQYMDDLLVAMDKIKASSDNISRIIKVIDDIAFQTNLLALNAAVEAARAGEHGKGFSIVAEEVRNLAGKSQKSAKETSSLIEEAISRVNDGRNIANQTAEALHTIVSGVSDIAGIITNIASASHEQSSAIEQIMIGTSQIADVVQTNSATSEEAASASEELSSQADLLRNLVGMFKLKQLRR